MPVEQMDELAKDMMAVLPHQTHSPPICCPSLAPHRSSPHRPAATSSDFTAIDALLLDSCRVNFPTLSLAYRTGSRMSWTLKYLITCLEELQSWPSGEKLCSPRGTALLHRFLARPSCRSWKDFEAQLCCQPIHHAKLETADRLYEIHRRCLSLSIVDNEQLSLIALVMSLIH